MTISNPLKLSLLTLLFSGGVFVLTLKATTPEFTSAADSSKLRKEMLALSGQLHGLQTRCEAMANNPSGCSPCKIGSLLQEVSGVSSRLRRLQSDLRGEKLTVRSSPQSDTLLKTVNTSKTVSTVVDSRAETK